MKAFLNEFKAFAMRGNVIDLAVGVIIGGAFQAIVKSLVDDILSPLIGLIVKQDFNELAATVFDVKIKYGSFITATINFIIMAFVIFLLVKGLNKLTSIGAKPAEEAPTTKECPFCKSEVNIAATRCPNCTSELSD
ncbi:MAG: large conductance mechanosensitive channel protein MscL [Abditibacteriota bacterium]|nr:large conductance mechanosensitive channel protein MscL [Abditibacteriota bacterium]MBP5092716.1 large conductance mechanosensitive channel protein MscL [Abditibacteriota bacterium]MBP5718638.1 large conductance mechanosensitive channel protein MscL [Abditibacteriota bacterium]MBP5738368.1 large conductance mechanosensitive channel protein MscL [Abditibacteriota bacterium]